MPKHLVFVGGGHAHLSALKNLRDTVRAGHRVTLIGPSTETCWRFSRGRLFNDSIPGATIS